MPLVIYQPCRFEQLAGFASRVPQAASLLHRPFVDWYYATSERCKLFLWLSKTGEVESTVGVEQMRFTCSGEALEIGFGSNFFTLREGVGGLVFRQWLKFTPLGMIFGGSDDAHRIVRAMKWNYFSGIRVYALNGFVCQMEDPAWKRAAKKTARRLTGAPLSRLLSRMPPEVMSHIRALEVESVEPDMIPRSSPFSFRFAPGLAELAWRYNRDLTCVRYRIFRLSNDGRACGYVVLNESPERVIVAHCDGDDAEILAYGVLLSLAEAYRNDGWPRPGIDSGSLRRVR